jgi:hypothetical protein
LVHENEKPKNLILVYSGSLVVEELVTGLASKKFIKVSEISVQQGYGFEILCEHAHLQRVSVNS